LASVTVMPCSPTSCSASFTSSSLKGLMTASIFFIAFPSLAGRRRAAGAAALTVSRVRAKPCRAEKCRPSDI
jgi:hypothetical protein